MKKTSFITILLIIMLSLITSPVYAASGLWEQTDWSGGDYESVDSIDTSVGGELRLETWDWWDSDWEAMTKITFDNSDQSENLDNFPVLVKLNSSRIDYTKTQNNGEDIRFIDGDGTLLAHEIESWDELGDSFVWVNVPRIDGGSSTDHIYMYYDNDIVGDGQSIGETWEPNFEMVHHFEEPSGNIADSSGNGVNGGMLGTPTHGITSKVGKGIEFNGSTDRFNRSVELFNYPNQTFTVEALFKVDDTVANLPILSRDGWDGGWMLRVENGNNPTFFLKNAAVNALFHNTDILVDSTQWVYFVVVATTSTTVINDNDAILYQDGVRIAGSPARNDVYALPVRINLDIGYRNWLTYFFDGVMDELRVTTGSRSDDWIAAQYKTIDDDFNTFSQEYQASDYSDIGTLVSRVHDAGGPTNWGVMSWDASGVGSVQLKARTSSSPFPDFSGCDYIVNGSDLSDNNCIEDGDRYIQYQVTMMHGADPSYTPILSSLMISYDVLAGTGSDVRPFVLIGLLIVLSFVYERKLIWSLFGDWKL